MSSHLELLELLCIELIFPDQMGDCPCLENITATEADYVHTCDDVLA